MRRRWPGILVVLATIVLVLATLSVWVARQVLNTDDWVHTSTALIRNPAIQQETAAYVGDQIDQQAIEARIRTILPPRLSALAPAAAGGVSELAQRATLRALQSGAFQQLWETTNRAAHEQLIKLVNGSGNAVVFDLRPMLGKVAGKIGLGADAVNSLPPDAGKVTIVKSDQLSTVRKAAKALRGLAIVLVLLWLVLTAAAVWLSHEKRRTIVQVGVGILSAGLLVLVLRRLLGHVVVGSITKGGASEPAAQATFDIGTSLLRQIAASVLALGLITMLCAWLAGPGRRATRVRGWMGPTLRDQPGIAYTAALVALLVLLVIGVIPGSGRIIPILIYIALAVAGVAALRREAMNDVAT